LQGQPIFNSVFKVATAVTLRKEMLVGPAGEGAALLDVVKTVPGIILKVQGVEFKGEKLEGAGVKAQVHSRSGLYTTLFLEYLYLFPWWEQAFQCPLSAVPVVEFLCRAGIFGGMGEEQRWINHRTPLRAI